LKTRFVLIFILALSIASCGYRFAGGEDFPFGIKKIFVNMFENHTGETGIEVIVTNDFIYEFTRSNKVDVVRRHQADAVFSGVIRSVSFGSITRSNIQTTLERRVRVTFDLKLTDRQGNVLWAARDVSDDETYDVTTEKLSTERNRRKAISRLSERMAQIIYNTITDLEDGGY
jgi:TolB-like protein